MAAILVTSYKSFELGIFQDEDERISVIKKVVHHNLIRYFERGIDWLIFMGNLSLEYWALQVAKELQEEYESSIATIFTFKNHGQNWNKANQVKLDEFKQAGFVKYTYKSYENPSQFRNYSQFLIDSTGGAYLFYDTENETTSGYLLQVTQEKEDYPINFLAFDCLDELLEEW